LACCVTKLAFQDVGMKKLIGSILASVVVIGLLSAALPGRSSYAQTPYAQLEADSALNRVYGLRQSASVIDVIDGTSLQVLSSVPMTLSSPSLRMTINRDGSRLAVSAGIVGQVALIDTTALTVTHVLTVPGLNPILGTVFGRSNRLYTYSTRFIPLSEGTSYTLTLGVYDSGSGALLNSTVFTQTTIVATTPDATLLGTFDGRFIMARSGMTVRVFDVSADTPVFVANTLQTSVFEDPSRLVWTSDGRVFTGGGASLTAGLTETLALGTWGFDPSAQIIDMAFISATQLIAITTAPNGAANPGGLFLFDTATQKPLMYYPCPGCTRLAAGLTDSDLFVANSTGVVRFDTALPFSNVRMPMMVRNRIGLNGILAQNGAPVAGEQITLRVFNGASWSTGGTAVTMGDGSFAFGPGSATGQRVYVRWRNSSQSPDGRIFETGSRDLVNFSFSQDGWVGTLDIADIPLVSPADGAVTGFPATFVWGRRAAVRDEAYGMRLYSLEAEDPFFGTGLLGPVDRVTLPSRPDGFSSGPTYGWDVVGVGVQGQYAISYGTNRVSFTGGLRSAAMLTGSSCRLDREGGRVCR
jgi:hypothetical protein